MPHNYSFENALEQWSRIPIDDFDYRSARELLYLHPKQRAELLQYAAGVRWDERQWRNKDGRLVKFMAGSPLVNGKEVLDFGCGLGLDGALFTAHGARVAYADINPANLLLAQHNLIFLTGKIPSELCLVFPGDPFLLPSQKFDLIWSLGVLHHTPKCGDILWRFCELLRPGGEVRAVLYSDKRWEQMMGEPALELKNTWEHPRFMEFVRKCDTVGSYADWYNERKLRSLIEGFAEVVSCEYLCNDQMIGAVIKSRGS